MLFLMVYRFTDNYTVDKEWGLIKEVNDRDYVKKRSVKIGINKYLKVCTADTNMGDNHPSDV